MNAGLRGTVITPAVLRDWPLPMPGDGKESRGHLLVVAGTATTRAPRDSLPKPPCVREPES